MKLNTKLVLIMILLLVIVTITQFIMNQFSQKALVQEIQDSTAAISQLLQKSVADLTSATDDEVSNLSDYVAEARRKGVNEVNIIDPDGEIIDSSNPEKIGKMRDLKKLGKEKGLKAVPGAKELRGVGGTLVKPYKLVVPVIIGDEQLGFVEIDLLLDNIREIQHDNFFRRVYATIGIFVLGIAVTIFLARRYTEPIQRLAQGVQTVASGDLSVTIPVEDTDEIGALATSFNEMVHQLKERKDLETRLRDAEHLSKVGQLAAGIAHEVRNPLNYINLAIGHLKEELAGICGSTRPDLAELADKIKEEVRRANYMVVNFMNYGRPLKVRREAVEYADLLARTLPTLEARMKEHQVCLSLDLQEGLPRFQADAELLRTCITNFVSNAAQAMPNGGTITLGASFEKEKGEILLTFADQGVGIAPDQMDKIFQPYFTTKEVGTGLGLAITERIVREHNGTIAVESSHGEGTLFTVTLPCQPTEESQEKKEI